MAFKNMWGGGLRESVTEHTRIFRRVAGTGISANNRHIRKLYVSKMTCLELIIIILNVSLILRIFLAFRICACPWLDNIVWRFSEYRRLQKRNHSDSHCTDAYSFLQTELQNRFPTNIMPNYGMFPGLVWRNLLSLFPSIKWSLKFNPFGTMTQL